MSSASRESSRRASSAGAGAEEGIAHVLLVGFHHKYGPQVEYAHPRISHSLEDNAAETAGRVTLPDAWTHLPFLALPDGVHKFSVDTTFFRVPSLDQPGQVLYGIACAQQIDVRELASTEDDVTRNTVLKSICVLCRKPLYNLVAEHLKPTTTVFFEQQDFGDTDLLDSLFHSLNRSIPGDEAGEEYLHEGLDARALLLRFRHRLLQMVKLLLLEPRVMVYGHGETRTVEVANCVMTLASLFPGCLRHGFKRGAVVPPDGGTALGDLSGAFDAASIEPPLVPSRASSVEPAMRFAAPDDVPAEAQDSAIAAEPTTVDVPSGDGPPASMAERTERACLPLCLCHNNVYPYVALQQLDKLQSDRSFLVGVTNALFARRPELSDAVVDVTAGTVEVKNKRLSKVMSLTTEDLRFIDGVLAVAVEATESEQGSSSAEWAGTNWVGSSAWVRAQFFEYVLGLMATADKVREVPSQANLDVLSHFNMHWFQEWRGTWSYAKWCHEIDCCAAAAPSKPRLCALENIGHPCRGGFKMSDMSRRVKHVGERVLGTERSKQFRTAAQSGGKAVKGAFSSLRSGLASMWASLEPPTSPEGDSGETIATVPAPTSGNGNP